MIPVLIEGRRVHRAYLDGGSECNVMYEHCFLQLNEAVQRRITRAYTPLVGFSGERTWPIGEIELTVTIGEPPKEKSGKLTFMVVKSPSSHNMLLGRSAMSQLGMVMSTIHASVMYQTKKGVGTIASQYAKPVPVLEAREETKDESPEALKVVINQAFPEQTITIGGQLPPGFVSQLTSLLQNNLDVFAWCYADMTGVPRQITVNNEVFNMEHRLNEYKHKETVKQKQRSLAVDRDAAACKEVEELTKAGILREAKYQSWVANPVMVKKSDGGWRMCVDFTDINKACPKDCYPLPEIDWKVESLAEFLLKCFLDAYKGYHQIQMAETDEDKITFFTSKGIYCYRKMPFGLKNAGATYQRLVDKVFSHQIGQNLEAYVDDMVIKSHTEEDLLRDIQETFDTLRSINMKLNPKKCSFGVEEGQFLGHLITKQGIKANPAKIDSLLNMSPPKTLKEVQSLNGKLAALSRFLSCGAQRSLPFFKTLKGCTDKKNFRWTKEANEAFEDMKKYITNLPTMVAPKQGETLIMYIASSKECVSAVLLAERDKRQVPIYFISRVLQGAEMNYPELEKLVLALIHATRRLRRYFQAHPIVVLTNKPIKQILAKPEKSGRVAKWAIELGEHDVEFKSRTSVKGQVLADFLAETDSQEETEPIESGKEAQRGHDWWKLFTDGASSSDGSGAGLMLIDPHGKEFTYALRFEFPTTNNEAEYEALLAGIRIAKEFKIQNLHTYVDSQLVCNQVKGIFEAKQPLIIQYLEQTRTLIQAFEQFEIEHIRRNQNKKADALSKLASMAFTHLAKEVLVEVLKERSIGQKEIADVCVEEGENWMTPICQYLTDGSLPKDAKAARKIRVKAPQYKLIEGQLYKRSFLSSWLRCVGPAQAKNIIQEVHQGSCGLHAGPRSVIAKVTTLGYYWPTMHQDPAVEIQSCENCQIHSSVSRMPQQDMTSVTSAWPFCQWGIDIVRPFPEAPGKIKFLIVAIDYFMKWVEAKPLEAISGKHVEKFVWEHIITRSFPPLFQFC